MPKRDAPCLETWRNVKTALPCGRELNSNPSEVSQRVCRNDANLENVRKALLRPSKSSHGGLKDPWRSLERPEDPVGPGAHTKALASWLYKDACRSQYFKTLLDRLEPMMNQTYGQKINILRPKSCYQVLDTRSLLPGSKCQVIVNQLMVPRSW